MLEDPKALGRAIKCYISAPISVNVENIRFSLMERNVQLLTPSDLPSGHELHQSTRELISNADLVIGVLRRGRQSQAVLFGLGMAAPMDRKIVVFALPKGSDIPFNLQSLLVLRIGLRNRVRTTLRRLIVTYAAESEGLAAHKTAGTALAEGLANQTGRAARRQAMTTSG